MTDGVASVGAHSRDHQATRIIGRFDDGMVITTFAPALRAEFRRLNLAWLERYFVVEPIDELVLGDPEAQILAPGGEVLFALLDAAVVGTVALKVEDERTFELTKMAVEERWQGRGYGRRLLDAALALSRERGISRVILYTQTVLKPAIALYRNAGFVECAEPLCRKYARCDLKMERALDE